MPDPANDTDAILKQYGATAAPAPDASVDEAVKQFGGSVQAPKSRSWLNEAADFAKGFWSQANPIEAARSAGNAILHPIATVSGIAASHDEALQKAEDSFKNGNYAEGVRHALGYIIPVVGPQIDAMGDKAESGHLSEALGEASGMGVMLGAPEALKLRKSPIQITPKAATTLNPVEQAAVKFGESRDVPIDAATATGNEAIKGKQALAARQPLGAGIAERSRAKQTAALQRVSGELQDQAYPGQVTPQAAGADVNSALQKNISQFKQTADQAYGDFRARVNDPSAIKTVKVGEKQVPSGVLDAQGNPIMKTVPITQDIATPVDMRTVKEALEPAYYDMQKWMEPAKRSASAGFQAIKSIVEGADYIPADQAEKGLGGLKTLARAENADLRDVNQAIGANATKLLQEQIDHSVSDLDPEAIKSLQKGRAAHASKMEVADLADRLREEPVQAFNQMTWSNDRGIDMLRKVASQAPGEMPKIGRAFLQQLFDKATNEGGFRGARGLLTQWENLGPETKKMLFSNPGLRQDLDSFFNLANKISENPNPSGSALVGSIDHAGRLMLTNPVSGAVWMVTGAGVAKLLYSQRGVRLLTEGLQIQPTAAARAAKFGQILKIVGDEAKPAEYTPSLKKAAQNDGAGNQEEAATVARPDLGAFERP